MHFLGKPARPICPNGKVLPNPDNKNLIIRRAPITEEGLYNTWPRFLAHYLHQDMAHQFAACPRFLFSHYSAADGRHDTV